MVTVAAPAAQRIPEDGMSAGANRRRLLTMATVACTVAIVIYLESRASSSPSSSFPGAIVPAVPPGSVDRQVQRDGKESALPNGSELLEIRPLRATLTGREVLWQFPPTTAVAADGADQRRREKTAASSSSPACPAANGVLFLYHGCNRRASSFFYSPQGRDMVRMALQRGMAVVAFPKSPVDTSCWHVGSDAKPTVAAGREWIERYVRPLCGDRDPPIFGFGASSGGSFVAHLAAGERDEGVPFRAINVQIMAPRGDWSVPTFFTVMSRDPRTRADVERLVERMKEHNVPTRKYVTKPKDITPGYFASQFPGDADMSEAVSQDIYKELVSMNAIDERHKGAGLIQDPRSLDLESILQKVGQPRPYGVSEELKQLLTSEELVDAKKLWLEEELNVAYDQHEITADGFSDVLDFFFAHSK